MCRRDGLMGPGLTNMRGDKPARIITIVAHDSGNGDFDIHVGERLITRLTWDEMLGTIAVITHPQLGNQTSPIPPYARLEHIDDLLYAKVRWREMCPRADKEIVAGLIEATGNTEGAIETRAAEWRKENGFQEVGE
jgi:hypothetical protein